MMSCDLGTTLIVDIGWNLLDKTHSESRYFCVSNPITITINDNE